MTTDLRVRDESDFLGKIIAALLSPLGAILVLALLTSGIFSLWHWYLDRETQPMSVASLRMELAGSSPCVRNMIVDTHKQGIPISRLDFRFAGQACEATVSPSNQNNAFN